MNKQIVAERVTSTDGPPASVGDKVVATGSTADLRELHLFRSLDADNDEYVRRRELLDALESIGLRADDVRLKESMRALDTFAAQKAPEPEIPQGNFCQAIRPNILLIERALQGNMVIPDFATFCVEIDEIYAASRENRAGKLPTTSRSST